MAMASAEARGCGREWKGKSKRIGEGNTYSYRLYEGNKFYKRKRDLHYKIDWFGATHLFICCNGGGREVMFLLVSLVGNWRFSGGQYSLVFGNWMSLESGWSV
ncbi:hypothetical protein L2E82_50445 [Cichorium intybus]|nr:hypothetical protein L2E82_50445 [Cichorium intybus]